MNTQWHWLWFQETQRITGDNERIKADDNCWVVAESCWWGDPSPDPGWFVASNNSDIDWMFPLDHDPAMGFNSNNAALTTTINSSGQAATYNEMLRFALELIHRAAYDSAAAICDSLIQSDPGAPGAIHAFSILWRSYRRSATSGFANILNSYIANYAGYELSGAARRIRAILASARGNVTEAIQSLTQVKNDFRGTQTHKHALYDLIDLYLFDLDDLASAHNNGWQKWSQNFPVMI